MPSFGIELGFVKMSTGDGCVNWEKPLGERAEERN